MEPEKCKIELRPDVELIWKLIAPEQCKPLLEAINKNQGKYSKKYLNRRVVFKETVQSSSIDSQTV
jgi:hypothetical protein